MNRLLPRLYLALSLLSLLGVTGFFFWRLAEVRSSQEEQASRAFLELSAEVGRAWNDQPLPEAGAEVSDRLVQPGGTGSGASPLVVGVYSFDRGIDYLWAVDGRFLEGVPELRGTEPRIVSNDLVHRRYTRSFQLPNGQSRIVTAVYPVLNRSATYPVLRDTLIVLLGVFALGLIVAIVHTLAMRPRIRRHADTNPTTGTQPRSPLAPADDTPLGLVPASALQRRLTLELERAGFHEQDLSIAVLSFVKLQSEDAAYRNAQAVLSFFTFEDLCFDGGSSRKAQEVVVIFPNASLSETLAQIERFQRFYWEERQEWSSTEADFYCGVTARNGRLVEADRMLQEGHVALKRANDAAGHIVGFHPDPQRYREFLSVSSS